MKLIEAEKAKDVIHEYFKSLMVNGASGTDVDRLAVGIGSCLKHDANLLKAINELPSAEPDTTTHDSIPAETGKNDGDRTSGDCISRTQAIDWIHGDADWLASQGSDWQVERMERDKSILMSLPSIQPELKELSEWKADFKGYINALNMPKDDYDGIMEYIDEVPSAQTEIIRCKDCKHSRFFDPCFYCYEMGGEIIVPENGFCFKAERRE